MRRISAPTLLNLPPTQTPRCQCDGVGYFFSFPLLLARENRGDAAGLTGDVKDIGISGSCVFPGREHPEHTGVVVADDVERAPLAMTLLLRRGEERHLIL